MTQRIDTKMARCVISSIICQNPEATFKDIEHIGSYINVDTRFTLNYHALTGFLKRMREQVERDYIEQSDATRAYLEAIRQREVTEREVFRKFIEDKNKDSQVVYLAKINGRYKQPDFDEIQEYDCEIGMKGAKVFVSKHKRVCLMGGKPNNLPITGGFNGRYDVGYFLTE